MLAVMNGKLSEGINFSDSLGRGVIVVGLPFPNIHELEVKENFASYLQTRLEEDSASLDKQTIQAEFLENTCMRVVNQSIGKSWTQSHLPLIFFIGRAIRHKDDYATMILIDERFSRESIKSKLPEWLMRNNCNLPNESFGASLTSIIQVNTSLLSQLLIIKM